MTIRPIDESPSHLRALVAELRECATEVWRLSGDDLAAHLTELEDLRRLCEGAQVAVLQEALDRGETGPLAPASLATAGAKAWVTHRFEECEVGGAVDPGRVSSLATIAVELGRSHDGREVLGAAVRRGDVPLRTAHLCLGEVDRITDLLVAGAAPAVWSAYTTLASEHPHRTVALLREAMLARYGHDERIERDHTRARRHASLSSATRDGALRKYQLVLDAERAAQLEAAVGALSAPQPEPDGSPDLRSVAARRADALMAVVTRGAAAGSSTPGPTKAALFLTIDWDALLARRGGGAVVGSVEDRTILPATTVARIACDAWLLPAAVDRDGNASPYAHAPGEYGSVLDVGRAERLFTLGQKRALILRDRHCTFPGCTTPATWCDAHHLRHWLDGGPSDLANAALLCGRHHTTVHRHRLAGRVDPRTRRVEWDLTPDGYDRLLRGEPLLGLDPGVATDSRRR